MIFNEPSLNKRVTMINQKFKPLMIAVIKQQKQKFYLIPLEIDDIYNELLFKVAKKAAFFDPEINDNFDAFLIIMIKYEVKNIIKKYLTFKHKAMNLYVPFEEYRQPIASASNHLSLKSEINHADFEILYDCFVNKLKKRQLYRKYFINKKILDQKILSAKKKLLI